MTSFKTLLNGIRAQMDRLGDKLSRLKARVLAVETWADKFEWVPTSDVQVICPETKLTGFRLESLSDPDRMSEGYGTATARNLLSGLNDGDVVTVEWDGGPYTCTVHHIDMGSYTMITLGKLSYCLLSDDLLDGSNSDDVPFLVLRYKEVSGNTFVFAGDDSAESHTFAIVGTQSSVDEMPTRFLPQIPSGKLPNKIPNSKLDLVWLPTVRPFAKKVWDGVFNSLSLNSETGVWSEGMTDFPDVTPGEPYQLYLSGASDVYYRFTAQRATRSKDNTSVEVTVLGNVDLSEVYSQVDFSGKDPFTHTDEPFCMVLSAVTAANGLTASFATFYIRSEADLTNKQVSVPMWGSTYNKMPQQFLPDDIEALVGKDLATEDYVTQAIQSAVDDTWEASY